MGGCHSTFQSIAWGFQVLLGYSFLNTIQMKKIPHTVLSDLVQHVFLHGPKSARSDGSAFFAHFARLLRMLRTFQCGINSGVSQL